MFGYALAKKIPSQETKIISANDSLMSSLKVCIESYKSIKSENFLQSPFTYRRGQAVVAAEA